MMLKFTVNLVCNDSKVSPQNLRALDKPQAKLCLLEVEKLDACIRPLFANPVTYITIGISIVTGLKVVILPNNLAVIHK